MKKSFVLASAALAVLVGGVSIASAQDADPAMMMKKKKVMYRPLNVTRPAPAPVAGPADAIGGAVAAPFGVAGGIVSGTVGGVGTLVQAPFSGNVGISGNAAPPLPIAARYANTGKVTTTFDEGYAQDVPVDASGPIYKLNYKESGERSVTPFTLLAFPISAATTVVTAPVRAIVAPHP